MTGPSGTTRLEYDGDKLVEEFNGAGTQLRVYAHGPGTDEPLVWWAGRRSGTGYAPGGTSSAGYGYDPAGRLQAQIHDLLNTSADQSSRRRLPTAIANDYQER